MIMTISGPSIHITINIPIKQTMELTAEMLATPK